jgi:hypothetical protein
MSIFAGVIVPVVLLAIMLRNWRLATQNGWRQILPGVGRYIGFSCLSGLVILPWACWPWFPIQLQSTGCVIYSFGYYISEFVSAVLLIALLYEFLRYTMPLHPEVRGGITAVLMFGVVIGALTGSLICLGCNLGYFRRLQPYGNAALNFQYLFLVALLVRLLLLKKRFAVQWGRSISLLLFAPLFFFLVEFVLRIIDYNRGARTVIFESWPEITGVVSAVLWWLALRNGANIVVSAQSRSASSFG